MLAAVVLGGCAGDPGEVAARGAIEVARHEAGPWARLDLTGVRELDAETEPAFVDQADPGRLFGYDVEHGTQFTQEFVVDSDGDAMTLLRNHLVAAGARTSATWCSDLYPELRAWYFLVESEDEVLRLQLAETPDGVSYTASLPTGRDRDGLRESLDKLSPLTPVRVVPPPLPCPRPRQRDSQPPGG